MITNNPTGWIDNPQAVRDYLAARSAAGAPAGVMQARPDLSGFWRRTVECGIYAVLLYEAEESLLGHYLPADHQRAGTCVGRGSRRAVQTTYWDALSERRMSGSPLEISYEAGYGWARVDKGRGAIRGDGCVGAWYAWALHEIGALPRGVHAGIDLTKDREDLAVSWGNRGVPEELKQIAAPYKCDAYNVEDASDLADVTAARYASAICSTHQQSDRRDNNGECAYQGPTAHCEAIVGVYLRATWDGNPETIYDHTGFVDQQSWGNTPSGPDILRFHNGDAKLREGAYGTPMKAMRSRIKTGETWAFRLRDGFVKSRTLAEVIR